MSTEQMVAPRRSIITAALVVALATVGLRGTAEAAKVPVPVRPDAGSWTPTAERWC